GSKNCLDIHVLRARVQQRGPNIRFDFAHRRTPAVRGSNHNAYGPVNRNGSITHDPKLDHTDNRNFLVGHAVEHSIHIVARQHAASPRYQLAPGCARATLCIIDNMWPRNSVCRPRRPPRRMATSATGRSRVARLRTSLTIDSHCACNAPWSTAIPCDATASST